MESLENTTDSRFSLYGTSPILEEASFYLANAIFSFPGVVEKILEEVNGGGEFGNYSSVEFYETLESLRYRSSYATYCEVSYHDGAWRY